MVNQDDLESEMLSLEGSLYDISINMVEIIEICDNLMHEIEFDQFGSDELETIGSKTLRNPFSHLLINEKIIDFLLIPKQHTTHDFKDIDVILQMVNLNVNTTLGDHYEVEDEEYNANDNN